MRQRYPIGKNELEFRDTLQWYGLRSQLQAPTSYAGVTVLAVRYRSSDRISAQTESRISVEATRMLPTRQGGHGRLNSQRETSSHSSATSRRNAATPMRISILRNSIGWTQSGRPAATRST